MKLILNEITFGESLTPYNKGFEDYKKVALLYLSHKNRALFAEDIIKDYRQGYTLQKVFDYFPERYIQGAGRTFHNQLKATWFDLWDMVEVVKKDSFFDFFFMCKLRQLNLLDVPAFLSFHLEYSFEENRAEFYNFLLLILRQYGVLLLSASTAETVNDWLKSSQEDKQERIKGRMPREAGDKLTTLNLNQTALLIQLMQKAGMILKGDYLTYSQAGRSFATLTGYSGDTLRQQLGAKGEIEGVKHEDRRGLYQSILRLAAFIEPKKV